MKVGDIVRHKSGGPLLLIISDDGPRGLFCRWFDTHNHLQWGWLKATEVMKA